MQARVSPLPTYSSISISCHGALCAAFHEQRSHHHPAPRVDLAELQRLRRRSAHQGRGGTAPEE